MNEVHVRVRAGGEHYALPVSGVREIANFDRVTPVPGAPDGVLGIWSLRGDVVPVIDLAALLGLRPAAEPNRIVIAEGGRARAGITVESVLDVATLPEAPEPTESGYLAGAMLIERVPVGVVDLEAVLASVGEEGRRA
jgi:purine-binding chemotaxis protein CheW